MSKKLFWDSRSLTKFVVGVSSLLDDAVGPGNHLLAHVVTCLTVTRFSQRLRVPARIVLFRPAVVTLDGATYKSEIMSVTGVYTFLLTCWNVFTWGLPPPSTDIYMVPTFPD